MIKIKIYLEDLIIENVHIYKHLIYKDSHKAFMLKSQFLLGSVNAL